MQKKGRHKRPEAVVDGNSYAQFKAIVSKYENTFKVISSHFYYHGTYNQRALMCDLVTYLWGVSRSLPPNSEHLDNHAWVYTILYRKAINLVRDEQRYQNHLNYGDDLSSLVDEESCDPVVIRLHQLIDRLDSQNRLIVHMYLDHIPVKVIARRIGKSTSRIYQILDEIQDKLRELNKQMEDNDKES